METGKQETQYLDGDDNVEDDDEDDGDEDFDSDDSNDEGMDLIAKEFGVKRYGWLVYMDKKTKEENRRQKEIVKGDPAIRKLSRKGRRKASQIEREREREAVRGVGTRVLHHDPYRPSSGHILEALHVDPASGVSLDRDKNAKMLKPPVRYATEYRSWTCRN